MLQVDLPPGPPDALLPRSFAACLAAVLELPVADVPGTDHDLPSSVRQWRGWLAGRGTGLVPVATPERFAWPGYWIAVLGDGTAGPTAAVMFGSPSGVVLSPGDAGLLGRAAADLAVQQGFVLAQLDPTLGAGDDRRPHLEGRVEAIAVAPEATAAMTVVGSARAVAGRGLVGDRYFRGAGTFSPRDRGRGYDLTLVEAEALDDLDGTGGRLPYEDARRNVVTRGIDLNALVGRRFRVGDVECFGQRWCEPCAHLERLTVRGVLRGLIHRGGLRADIRTGGTISTGVVIETVDDDPR